MRFRDSPPRRGRHAPAQPLDQRVVGCWRDPPHGWAIHRRPVHRPFMLRRTASTPPSIVFAGRTSFHRYHEPAERSACRSRRRRRAATGHLGATPRRRAHTSAQRGPCGTPPPPRAGIRLWCVCTSRGSLRLAGFHDAGYNPKCTDASPDSITWAGSGWHACRSRLGDHVDTS